MAESFLDSQGLILRIVPEGPRSVPKPGDYDFMGPLLGPDKLKPSFVHGQSDGGKGVWSYNSRTSGSDSTWAKYQSQVTGAPDGTEYLVKTDLMSSGQKWFDGYDPNRNVLLDAKRYLDWPKENLPFSVNKVVEDARMESAIAKQLKTKVEWHIPSQEKADLVQQLLRENRIKHINVVYSPIGG
jgi:hypothetical protein